MKNIKQETSVMLATTAVRVKVLAFWSRWNQRTRLLMRSYRWCWSASPCWPAIFPRTGLRRLIPWCVALRI